MATYTLRTNLQLPASDDDLLPLSFECPDDAAGAARLAAALGFGSVSSPAELVSALEAHGCFGKIEVRRDDAVIAARPA